MEYLIHPSHGWLKVEKNTYRTVMGKECTSCYSFEDDEHYYLEEDCDATEFFNELPNDVDANKIPSVHIEVYPDGLPDVRRLP